MTHRHRDRHGRGLRGPLAPAESPLSVGRGEQFDELVLEAVDRVEQRWSESLRAVEFVVEDVPPPPTPDADVGAASAGGFAPPVRLGRAFPSSAGKPARAVVYRRPIEGRAIGRRAREALVNDVVVEVVAELLGLEPETVDPDYPQT